MPNLAIGLCIGIAAWTICMGSTAISGGLRNRISDMLPSSSVKHLKNSSDLQQRNQELPCIGGLFGEIDWKQTNNGMNGLKNENTKGCVTVWWDKETYDSKNWRGSWNLLWGMRDDDYGIIFFQSFKANNGKIIFDSLFYNLENRSKWTLISSDNYPDSTNKEIKKSEANQKMLLPKDEEIKQSEGWSFNFNDGEICSSSSSCTGNAPVNKHVSSTWNFVPESRSKEANFIHEWFKDLGTFPLFGSGIKLKISNVKGSFELSS